MWYAASPPLRKLPTLPIAALDGAQKLSPHFVFEARQSPHGVQSGCGGKKMKGGIERRILIKAGCSRRSALTRSATIASIADSGV
jgi:hypothetical protein